LTVFQGFGVACALILMDGLEATRRIRHLPGHAVRQDSDTCLEAGMDGFIPTLVLLECLPPARFWRVSR